MAQDYAKRGQRKKSEPVKRPIPSWIWLVTGFMLGIFLSFLIYLVKTGSHTNHKQSPPINNKTAKPSTQNQKPRFDFYTLLAEAEMPSTKTKQVPTVRKPKNHSFWLQAGSFRAEEDADNRRRDIILFGLDAQIKTAKIRQGETWFRVLVGPFKQTRAAQKAQATLTQKGIESLAIKAKNKTP